MTDEQFNERYGFYYTDGDFRELIKCLICGHEFKSNTPDKLCCSNDTCIAEYSIRKLYDKENRNNENKD